MTKQLDQAIFTARRKVQAARAFMMAAPWPLVKLWLARECEKLEAAVADQHVPGIRDHCERLARAFKTLRTGVTQKTFERDFRA